MIDKNLSILDKNVTNFDYMKLPAASLKETTRLKVRDVELKIPNAKKDMMPLWKALSLGTEAIMGEEEFMLIKHDRLTLNGFDDVLSAGEEDLGSQFALLLVYDIAVLCLGFMR